MPTAGSLSTRVRFERRAVVADDGEGNRREAWQLVALRWASWRPQSGKAAIEAGGRAGVRSGVIVVHSCAVTRGLGTEARVVFATGPESGTVAAITSVVPRTDAVEIAVEIGGAV